MAAGNDAPLLRVEGLTRRYGVTCAPVLEDLHLELRRGEYIAIMGESGVGKSTFLNLVAGLDRPDAGRIVFDGTDLTRLSDDELTLLRRRSMGFVFQAFHVLPYLDVLRNVTLPLELLGVAEPERRRRADELLEAVGLGARPSALPRELSGGELQRVAIARALVHRPALLLADEPTGNLDPHTAAQVLEVLGSQLRAHGGAAVLITHSRTAADTADRIVRLDGRRFTPVAPAGARPSWPTPQSG
ncbi:MAG: ABC transporter ATP-binding protein [Steroidobacteraceae bacterium]